ncbi:MAG: UMP kinase [Hyphomicrobiaceae bacterium]|nr:UMP kinase [Hyphomicrobiaceae bacterium]
MPASATPKPLTYKRVLLKLSGEALMGTQGYGIDPAVVTRLSLEVKDLVSDGLEVALVVGGGNIYRGLQGAAKGMDRATGDYMGMLATVMNALAVQNGLGEAGVPARVLSAISMPTVCETYVRPKALHHLSQKRVVIFAAGTGNPFFTTDTTAALRAAEMNCQAILMAKQGVDGIYSADPKKDPKAVHYDRLTYAEVFARNLKVMDGAAIALARDNDIPVIVFSIDQPGNIKRVLAGQVRSTIVTG